MSASVEPGTLFKERYEIIRCLGVGGMGAVYLARDPRYDGFFVALKVLYPGIMASTENRERFRNEIVASYRVNHENVVRAYEYFDDDDFQAYAMEYVDGGDLAIKMSRGPIPFDEAFSLIKQMAQGLGAIHQQGILHRDLKPENILLTKHHKVKISDFGVARLRDTSTITKAGAMVGTLKYLSPEYIETGECDQRGDIFALGVIGYEMLAGHSPFKADSGVALITERFRRRAEPLERIRPELDPCISRIIEKAMSIRIKERYANTADMLRDLEMLERGETPSIELTPVEVDRAHESPEVLRGRTLSRIFQSAHYRVGSRAVKIQRYLIIALSIIASWLGYLRFVDAGNHTSLRRLPDGRYAGVVSGALSENMRYPLVVWRTGRSTHVLFGKQHCAAAALRADSTFSCGDLSFRIEMNSFQERRATGTITELSWGTGGTWILEESID